MSIKVHEKEIAISLCDFEIRTKMNIIVDLKMISTKKYFFTKINFKPFHLCYQLICQMCILNY